MTTNDLRVGERMQHRGGVTYYSSRSLYDDLAVAIERFPGRAATSRCFVLVHGIGVSSRYFHPLATERAKSGEVFLIIVTDYLVRCGIPYFFAQLTHLLADRIEGRLPSIEARTLVLRGDSDPIVPRSWAETVAELLPNGVYAEVTGPHVVMHSDPVCIACLVVKHSA